MFLEVAVSQPVAEEEGEQSWKHQSWGEVGTIVLKSSI